MTSHQCRRSCNGRRNTATLRCWFQNVQNKSLICIWVTMKTGMEISRRHTSPQSPTINQLSLIQFKHNTMEISWIWIFYLNPHPTVLIYIHFYLRNSLKCYLAMCKKVTKKKQKKPGSTPLLRSAPKIIGVYSRLRHILHWSLWKSMRYFLRSNANKPTG